MFETTGARKSIKRRCDWKLIDLSERTFHFCELGQPLFPIGFARVSSGSTHFSLGLTVQRSAFSDDTTLAKPTRYFDDPDQFACDYFGRDFAFPLEIYGAREENAVIGGHPWDIHRLVSRILLGGPELQASDFRLSGPGSGSTFLTHVASSGKSLSILHQQIVESPATNYNFSKRVVTGYQPCNSSAEDYNELHRIVLPYQFHNAGSTS